MKGKHSVIALLLLLLAGLVLGGLIGELAGSVSWLSWLGYSKSFGIDTAHPFILDLNVVKLTFGMTFRLDVASILGLVAAFFTYRKLF